MKTQQAVPRPEPATPCTTAQSSQKRLDAHKARSSDAQPNVQKPRENSGVTVEAGNTSSGTCTPVVISNGPDTLRFVDDPEDVDLVGIESDALVSWHRREHAERVLSEKIASGWVVEGEAIAG